MTVGLIVGLFVGCAGSGDSDSGLAGQEPVITYLVGVSVLTSFEGYPLNEESAMIIKKTIDPAASTLSEEIRTPTEAYNLSVPITGSSFAGPFTLGGASLEIEGTYLAGETWSWTAWESTTTYVSVPDCTEDFCLEVGDYIFSSDEVRDGALFVEKAYYRQGATEATFTIEEELAVVDEAAYEEAVAGLE